MKLITHIESKYTIIEIVGEVDAVSSLELDAGIRNAFDSGTSNLLFDCKELIYISSAGLGVFMSFIKSLETNKKQMILFDLEESVFSTFEILGLHHVVCIVKSKSEALSLC
jgi:anti-sigma B factor antagonist